jgi:hypothetical protein
VLPAYCMKRQSIIVRTDVLQPPARAAHAADDDYRGGHTLVNLL